MRESMSHAPLRICSNETGSQPYSFHPADDGVQPDRAGALALVQPEIRAVRILAQFRLDRLVLHRKMLVVHGGRLDDMVVDADDNEILNLHGIDPLPKTDMLLVF